MHALRRCPSPAQKDLTKDSLEKIKWPLWLLLCTNGNRPGCYNSILNCRLSKGWKPRLGHVLFFLFFFFFCCFWHVHLRGLPWTDLYRFPEPKLRDGKDFDDYQTSSLSICIYAYQARRPRTPKHALLRLRCFIWRNNVIFDVWPARF